MICVLKSGGLMANGILARIYPFFLPLARLMLAIVLIKVVAHGGGYGYLDVIALAGAHSSFAVLPSLPLVSRVRGVLVHTHFLRRSIFLWRSVLPSAVLSVLIFFACLIFLFLVFRGRYFPNGDAFWVYCSVLVTSVCSVSLLPVEYISSRLGRQAQIRMIEFAAFVFFAAISLFYSSPYVAACSVFLSTLVARLIILFVSCKGVVLTRSAFGASMSYAFRFVARLGGWKLFFGNSCQCLASASLYSFSFDKLPSGVIGQLAIAYRFAGPIQLISTQLAYTTLSEFRVAKFARIFGYICVLAISLSFVLPFFIGSYLGLPVPDGVGFLGALACLHMSIQGFCQVGGGFMYTSKRYDVIALAAIPHAVLAVLAPVFVYSGFIDDAYELTVLILFVSVSEFLLIAWRARGGLRAAGTIG